MFTGNGVALVGDDGALKEATFGSEVLGDAATALPVGVYMVTNVATVSAFPATALGGSAIAAGDILVVKTGDSITPAVNDDVVTLTLTDQCDLSSWAMEFSKERIDTTTLCDLVKTGVAGKADMSGTMSGIFKTGVTNSTTGKMLEFLPLAFQDGDQSFDRFDQSENIRLGFFYLNTKTNKADEQYIVAPFQYYGQAAGGELGNAQTFSSPFYFANKTYTVLSGGAAGNIVTLQPTLYRLGDGA